jgi:amidohydrolase
MATPHTLVTTAIQSQKKSLNRLSNEIWQNPELCFEEHAAHKVLTDYLEGQGFAVERHYCGMKTAFRAKFGSGKPNVCVICEYDALPEIGHACGHNLIAEAGIAAGIGVKAYLEKEGCTGTVTVMGTPAEEGGGGKVQLIEKGGFDGIDIAIMAHPAPVDIIAGSVNARTTLSVEFTGKASHAAAFPWEGINALDAVVSAYNNVSVMRQQMKPTWRTHCIVTNGGAKPNIIPEKASLLYYIRAPNLAELQELRDKVTACFEGAAKATKCTAEIKEVDVTYTNLHSNPILAKLFAENYDKMGVKDYMFEGKASWSTDMGNVSYVVPSLHPTYAIGSGKEFNHTREFTAVTNTPEAHEKTLLVGATLALTCIDVLKGSDALMKEINDSFKKQIVQ